MPRLLNARLDLGGLIVMPEPEATEPTTMVATRAATPARPQASTNRPPAVDRLTMSPHPDGWALLVDDIETPAWVVSTKRTAVKSARRAARDLACQLVVQTRTGRVSRSFDYRGARAS